MEILKRFPKHPLGLFPTPLHELTKLSQFLNGPRIFIKREDLNGLAFGGNKVRKLEYLCGQALFMGCDTLVTAGAIQSNHCRLTAGAATYLGLKCHLLLGGHELPKENINGNLLLDKLLNAEIHWEGEKRKGENLEKVCEELKKQGKKPYCIPYGGSNVIGALGYVNAMLEISEQLKSMKTHIDAIIFASSSGGTHAGLMVGKGLTNFKGKILGIRIDKEEISKELPFKKHIENLVNETCDLCGIKLRSDNKIELNEKYIENPYGVITNLEKNAIKLLCEKEAIFVDPVYTGRAFGGMLDMIKQGEFKKGQNILFIHSGGLPSLFFYNKELL